MGAVRWSFHVDFRWDGRDTQLFHCLTQRGFDCFVNHEITSTLESLSYGPVEVNACHLSINLTIYVLEEKYLAFSNVPICPIT